MANEHRLNIPGEIAQVPGACSWVVEVAEGAGMTMRDANHLELAVDEAVTNIIEHGYGGSGGGRSIDIIVSEDGSQFKITIVDEGPPFDPLSLKDPDPTGKDVEDLDIGGWGFFFIKKVMDSVYYQYKSDRNHLIMTKKMG
ncbi:MAG: ATP-binding protein [Chloroflexota bacterium]